MARKNTLFEVDITKENPLLTILKYGKIPVVRFSNKGFQNYKQEKYYKSRENLVKGNTLKRGCFVHMGGVQGAYVSGGHWKENLNIGYVEPNEIVYATYSFGNRKTKTFSFTTAKERFDDAIKSYQEFMKQKEIKNYSLEDFDIYVEAIVDSTKIKKVLTLEPKDFSLLIPFSNDNFYRIYDIENIFSATKQFISKEFWDYISFPTAIEDEELQWKDNDYSWGQLKYFSDFYEKYGDKIIKEFEFYFKNNKFLKSKYYYKELKESFLESEKLVKNSNKLLKENVFDFLYDENDSMFNRNTNVAHNFNISIYDNKYFISLDFNSYSNPSRIDTITFNSLDNIIRVTLRNEKYRYGDNKEPQYLYFDLDEKDIYSNKYRYYLYNFIFVFEEFYKIFHKFYNIIKPKWFDRLKTFYEIELFLSKYEYKFNDNYFEFYLKTNEFILEYNIVLKDSIITIPNSELLYYNLENIPKEFDKNELYKILKVLDNLGP